MENALHSTLAAPRPYYLALQNYSVLAGFQGFQKIAPPMLFGIDWRSPTPFYFLSLALALAGLWPASAGEVTLGGAAIHPASEARARIACVLQAWRARKRG